jgi:two-component system, NtrC family, sensor kinase
MSEQESDPAAEPLNNLGHLSSAVGHHVINAFSAVVSSAEILRIRMAGPAQFDPSALADMIINTALEAASVARRLIDYTRPITNIGEEPLLLHELVAGYVEAARAAGAPGTPAFATDLAPVPPIRGNAVHLRTMLGLLLDNAREAMAGRPDPTVTYSTSVDGRGWVALEVRDSGRGMTPDVMERAVEPFFTTKAGQMGVGLSIANGIWRRHKGTLSLKSAPGEGTTLRLCVEPIGF